MARKFGFAGAAVAALVLTATALAAPSNGGFERGAFDGWDRTEPGGGQWVVYTASDEQPSPPPQGTYAAAVTQSDPGLNILHRKLDVDNGRYLSFQLAYENEGADRFAAPKSFKFDGRRDNQQLRVDLLKSDAKIRSLRSSDILKTVFRTKEDTALSSPYELYVVDLKDAGIKGKFQLRFAEVDNITNWFVGVDQVNQTDTIP